jgi:hypothetical protein
LPEVFAIEFFELCPHRRKPSLEYIDDLIADLGRGENGSVYKPAPAIDLILSTDDHFIGIAIHDDQALRFLDLLHQIIDGHDLSLHWRASEMGLARFKPNHPSFEMGFTRQKPSAATFFPLILPSVGRTT